LYDRERRKRLKNLASAAEEFGANVLVFSNVDPEKGRCSDWVRTNMDLCSFVPQEEIIPTLRRDADALFLPMGFSESNRVQERTNFPSKLTEYTATGLPLIVHGPPNSSGVRWARKNSGVAEVVTSPGKDALRPALRRLVQDPDHRLALGEKALDVGEQYFAPETVWSTFCQTIR
jgi:glycosyltransferase involved in cell wall biosynthesis